MPEPYITYDEANPPVAMALPGGSICRYDFGRNDYKDSAHLHHRGRVRVIDGAITPQGTIWQYRVRAVDCDKTPRCEWWASPWQLEVIE